MTVFLAISALAVVIIGGVILWRRRGRRIDRLEDLVGQLWERVETRDDVYREVDELGAEVQRLADDPRRRRRLRGIVIPLPVAWAAKGVREHKAMTVALVAGAATGIGLLALQDDKPSPTAAPPPPATARPAAPSTTTTVAPPTSSEPTTPAGDDTGTSAVEPGAEAAPPPDQDTTSVLGSGAATSPPTLPSRPSTTPPTPTTIDADAPSIGDEQTEPDDDCLLGIDVELLTLPLEACLL